MDYWTKLEDLARAVDKARKRPGQIADPAVLRLSAELAPMLREPTKPPKPKARPKAKAWPGPRPKAKKGG